MKFLYIGKERSVELQLEQLGSVLILDNMLQLLKMSSVLAKVDVVVADKIQKGMDIVNVASLLHQNGLPQSTPVIVFGSSFTKRECIDLLKSGIAELAQHKEQLFSSIRWALGRHKTETSSHKNVKTPVNTWLKRAFDLLFSAVFLLLISPVLMFVVLAIRLDSKGPIIYKSKRVGQGYKIFDFLKFRTMKVNADRLVRDMQDKNQYKNESTEMARRSASSHSEVLIDALGNPIDEETFISRKKQEKLGTFFKIQNDPRITRVGRFLRSTSLDELPQLFNVLKGEMSLIGNRPLPLYEAEQLTTDEWVARFKAPAGITGLWQVKKRGKGEMSEKERKKLDNYYAQNGSFLFDLKIMLQTIPALLQKENV